MTSVSLNIQKTVFIAKTVDEKGEELYLTCNYWGGIESLFFKEHLFLKPFVEIVNDGNQPVINENCIIKGASIAEVEQHLKNCKYPPKTPIQIVKVEIKMAECVAKSINCSYFEPIFTEQSMKKFEKYFKDKKLAKENGYSIEKMLCLRNEKENRYDSDILNDTYQIWLKYQEIQ